MRNTICMRSFASWIQLILFTCFLFLLVAIPYTIYLRASQPKSVGQITSLPVAKPTSFPSITPPPPSTTTACIAVPDTYLLTTATPAAYFFQGKQKKLCYPPALPPFPFTWQPYTSYQYGYTLDTPSNWADKSTTLSKIALHIFSSDAASTAATVSFAWYPGNDSYASDASYLKQPIVRDGQPGTIYTKTSSFIAALFPVGKGYLLLESSSIDSAFYAFQHMLDSLKFVK